MVLLTAISINNFVLGVRERKTKKHLPEGKCLNEPHQSQRGEKEETSTISQRGLLNLDQTYFLNVNATILHDPLPSEPLPPPSRGLGQAQSQVVQKQVQNKQTMKTTPAAASSIGSS
jgi:hypothetical protein